MRMGKNTWIDVGISRERLPKVSIVIPVYNQSEIILKNIESIYVNISCSAEILLVVDKCTDGTEKLIQDFLDSIKHSTVKISNANLIRLSVYFSSKTLHETKSDKIGFLKARGEFIIEIQSDMRIMEKGFDKKLVSALVQHPKLMAISGRGCTTLAAMGNSELYKRAFPGRYLVSKIFLRFRNSFRPNINSQPNKNLEDITDLEKVFPSQSQFENSGIAGWRGSLIDRASNHFDPFSPLVHDLNSVPLYIGQLIMRGPLCMSRTLLLEMGNFDDNTFYFGYDDTELYIRGFIESGLRVGFVPIQVYSPEIWGSSRKAKSFMKLFIFWSNIVIRSKRFRESLVFSYLSNPERTSEIVNKMNLTRTTFSVQ